MKSITLNDIYFSVYAGVYTKRCAQRLSKNNARCSVVPIHLIVRRIQIDDNYETK